MLCFFVVVFLLKTVQNYIIQLVATLLKNTHIKSTSSLRMAELECGVLNHLLVPMATAGGGRPKGLFLMGPNRFNRL